MRKVPLILAGLGALALAAVLDARPARAQDWRTVSMARRAEGEHSLHVDLEYGAGQLSIQPTSDDVLYRAVIRYDADHFHPVTNYSDGQLDIGLKGGDHVHVDNHKNGGRLTLWLGTRVPADLDLKFGAVQANLELGGLPLRNAHIATGASETTVRFSKPNPLSLSSLQLDIGAASFKAYDLGNANARQVTVNGGVADVEMGWGGQWRQDCSVQVKMGLGSVTFRVPRDVGVKIHRTGFLASFDGPGFNKRGGEYYSANWSSASRRLVVDVESAFGSFNVDWTSNALSAGQ